MDSRIIKFHLAAREINQSNFLKKPSEVLYILQLLTTYE